jgi:phage portal protein BeeE
MPIRTRKAGIGIEAMGPSLSGDATVSSVVASGSTARVPDLEVYWMLATKHPYVGSCISLIAQALASDGFDVAPAEAEQARPLSADDDPRVKDIRAFFALAGVDVTDRARRHMIAFDVLTFGFAAELKKRANGTMAGLERIDPRTLSVKTNPAGTEIVAYVVRRRSPEGTWDPTFKAVLLDPKDVIFYSITGGNPLMSFASPLEQLDLTLAVDFAQRRFREAYCRLGAKPGLILSSDTVSVEDMEAARSEISKSRSGSENAYKTMLLPGAWTLLNKPESGSDDADFVKGAGLNREDVAGVYHVPTGMITYSGNALGSSGKGDDRDFFEQFAVLPLEEILYERMSAALLRDEFDITDLTLAPARRNRVRYDRFDAAVKLVQFGGTGNEARRLVNLPAITDEKYDMDAPLFTKVTSAAGITGVEPLNPSENTGLQPVTNKPSDQAAASASAAKTEVAQKGKARFRVRY